MKEGIEKERRKIEKREGKTSKYIVYVKEKEQFGKVKKDNCRRNG